MSLLLVAYLVLLTACGDGGSKTNEEASTKNGQTKEASTVSEAGGSDTEENTGTDAVDTEEDTTFDIVITMVGDVMLAEYKNETSWNGFNTYATEQDPTYFFSGVSQYFTTDDVTIVNLENVFTDQTLAEREKDENPGYWYYSKTDNAGILSAGSVEIAGIVNNHTRDYGEEGYADTQAAIEAVGVKTAGFSNVAYYEVNGFTIAVVACRLWVWGQESEGLALLEEAEEQSDFQIAYFHGGQMNVYTPDDFKVAGAHAYVDAGFDLVIGSHPHCLQPREIYEGTEIVYSLGNFCYGGSKHPDNRTIIYQYTLTVDQETMEVVEESSEIIPCYLYTGDENVYCPSPITDETEKQAVLDFMDGLCATPYGD